MPTDNERRKIEATREGRWTDDARTMDGDDGRTMEATRDGAMEDGLWGRNCGDDDVTLFILP